jgi:mRNA interferase YafQ
VNTLVKTSAFERAYKKFVKRNPRLMKRIDDVLLQMENDPYAPFLETHKLSGTLAGTLACSCGFDCRILFKIVKDKITGKEMIILLSIGTHDAMY